jgi:sec-independent protein translocase protein TatA
MGQLGFSELILIFVIALLVFGPKKLPELGKSLGKGLREFKKATDDIKSNWDEHMKDVEKSVDDVKTTVNDATRDIDRDLTASSYTPYQPPSASDDEKPKEAAEESKKEVHQT